MTNESISLCMQSVLLVWRQFNTAYSGGQIVGKSSYEPLSENNLLGSNL